MRKRFRTVLAILIVASAGAAWMRSQEPSYKGKRLSVWLKDYESLASAEPRDVTVPVGGEADEAVRHIGTNAIPTLLRLLYAEDSAFKTKLNTLAEKQHFITIHFPTAYERNQAALYGFAALGSAGKSAVPVLVQGLRNKDGSNRQNSAWALCIIHAEPESAVPALIQCLRDSSSNIQEAAINALAAYKPPAKLVMPELVRCLQVSDCPVQSSIIALLKDYGAAAKPAVPTLVHLFKTKYDKYSQSTWIIAVALEAIDPEAAAKAGVK